MRPTEPHRPESRALNQDFGEVNGQNSVDGVSQFAATHGRSPSLQQQRFHDGSHGSFNRRPRPHLVDRPKSKQAIPGCAPWVLVKTKLGRRFVFNTESRESLWKFPTEVMKGVVEYDRTEREKRERALSPEVAKGQDGGERTALEKPAVANGDTSTTSATRTATASDRDAESSDDEYEEMEVTDDEEDENPAKRQKAENGSGEQPVEFNEDDIAFQLASMGQDHGLDPGEYGDEGNEIEEGAEGLPLTEEDAHALFMDMLNDYNISPYITWDKIIEDGQMVEDDRYTVLPNMKSRKEVWGKWSRERIQQLKEQRETAEKKDPRIPYMAFLQRYATPKLYWPEFKRKYKKEAEMRNAKLSDKDRERWYREHVNRMLLLYLSNRSSPLKSMIGLKLPESTLKSDLNALLQFLPLRLFNRSSTLETLPPVMLADPRYISLKPAIRDEMIESHIQNLSPAPIDCNVSAEAVEFSRQRQERHRREMALTDRQRRVDAERRRQKGALQYSKDMLEGGEQELERAKKVSKEGLMGHMQRDELMSGSQLVEQ